MRITAKEKEKIIKNYMLKLQLTEEEALELFAFDYEGATNQTVEELSEKAKEMPRFYERIVKDDSETPKKTRQRKPNEIKAAITSTAESALISLGATALTTIPEKTIDFTYNSKTYTLKLTKHNTYVGIKETKAEKRKVNTDKDTILTSIVAKLYCADYDVTDILVQTETKINFNIAETNYTLALTAHRK